MCSFQAQGWRCGCWWLAIQYGRVGFPWATFLSVAVIGQRCVQESTPQSSRLGRLSLEIGATLALYSRHNGLGFIRDQLVHQGCRQVRVLEPGRDAQRTCQTHSPQLRSLGRQPLPHASRPPLSPCSARSASRPSLRRSSLPSPCPSLGSTCFVCFKPRKLGRIWGRGFCCSPFIAT